MYKAKKIERIFQDENLYNTLLEYDKWLARRYNETNLGEYRMKYNFLHAFLFSPLSDEKRIEFFNNFASCMNIYPITHFGKNISLKLF